MNPEAVRRLHRVLKECALIRSFASDVDRAAFLQDEKTVVAIERCFTIIGEALFVARREAPELEPMIPDMRRAIRFSHMLQRTTFPANWDIVWSAVTDLVPRLDENVRETLRAVSTEEQDALIRQTDPFLKDSIRPA